MLYKNFILCFFVVCFMSCKEEMYLEKIEGKRIEINDSLVGVSKIEDFIKPYREHVNNTLDSVLAYSAGTYSKTDGDLNTAIGNLMADAVLEEANPVFESRTGKKINMVLLNHGGIRAILSKGNVTTRTAYEIMPFENSVVVASLKGTHINEMIAYLQKAKRAHPISGLSIKLNNNYELIEAKINDNAIDENKTYYVATNDYLYSGGDSMDFFQQSDSLYVLDYKIRNVLIDYFSKKDTINPVIDNRFIKTN
ncbi:MAG: 5'-nucleotidase [Flavobacteriaceae bacterium]|nr:5'-nucleotidase C-terminal domain-containing protein [Flavobacteriaceae bacterium]